jgi:hypothetical protein
VRHGIRREEARARVADRDLRVATGTTAEIEKRLHACSLTRPRRANSDLRVHVNPMHLFDTYVRLSGFVSRFPNPAASLFDAPCHTTNNWDI